jgi:mannose-6-phosphate isomerase-like protein (cupin superfamily)
MADEAELLRGAAADCLRAISAELAGRAAGDPRLAPFASGIALIGTGAVQRGPFPRLDHPAMAHLETALESAPEGGALRDAALAAARWLDWSQVFAGGGIEPALVEGMLAAQLAGSYGCFASQEIAAGLFLLAPGIFYPLHSHAAAEIYCCLSGALQITHGVDGAPFDLAPGNHSVTPPNRLHSLRTGEAPVLVIYVWSGDLMAPNWWWDRDADGNWRRTAWHRAPGEPWKPVHSEPVTAAVMAEAHE